MAKAKAAGKLYTLTEVARQTNISMPTLQRYKKLYQDRIPSQGQGRLQRYPGEALDVFRQLKKENIGRRGRPRKNAAAKVAPAKARGRKPAAKPAARAAKAKAAKPADGLLTLTQIGQMTGISYPTLLRYVKTNLKALPHKGTGRARRFKPEAVPVFKDMRSKSKRGRKAKKLMAAAAVPAKPKAKAKAAPKAARKRPGRPPKTVEASELLSRINSLEKTNARIMRDLARIQKKLSKPIKVVWR